jgi:DNA-directed RNA polymerase alpha subunit
MADEAKAPVGGHPLTIQAERTNGEIELVTTPNADLRVTVRVHTGRQQSDDNPELGQASVSIPLSPRAAGELYRAIETIMPNLGSE